MKHAPITNVTRMGGQPVERRHVSPKHMAAPKPDCRGHMPDVRIDLLDFAIGRLAPDERLALEQIAQTADLVEIEGCTPYLLIPTTPALLDVLAALGAEAMDRGRIPTTRLVATTSRIQTTIPTMSAGHHGRRHTAWRRSQP